MKGRGTILLLTIFIILPLSSSAQEDSLNILSYRTFMERVDNHHPLAYQANLQLIRGEATVQRARGAFDPMLFTDFAEKFFNNKEYYSRIDGGLKIPTWFGMELQSGYEQNEGIFLDPENTTPGGGLWYAGISFPIGQGLFIDKRRAELRKAQLFEEISEAERQLMLNDLLYDAGRAYWEWFNAYHIMNVYEEAYALAEQRFFAVKRGAALGDRPSIDTLEASIQVQDRLLNLQEAQLDFNNATALLSIYLWEEGFFPLEVESGTLPMPLESVEITGASTEFVTGLDSLIQLHPQLRQYDLKLDQLEIEKRWQQEQLKPRLNLKYNALAEPINGDPIAAYTPNNYTWGLEFRMPLFLRRERGSVKLADVNLQETAFDFSNKSASLFYKAQSSINTWNTTEEQVILYRRTVSDYQALLVGERRLFNAGESSLFLVNARETSYINAQIKLIDLLTKNHKARLTTRYAFGILNPDEL
ncbi:MAG: TolC family protein [Candidatus Cyclobacteriaceae bacterium M2_1C_046]